MGIVNVAIDSLGGVLADQWKDIVTAGHFDEHMVVVPGVRKTKQGGRGGNYGADDVLSNGSLIFVPENTAAFIFSQAGIEQVITEPGGFEYHDGEASVFDDRDREEQGVFKDSVGSSSPSCWLCGHVAIAKARCVCQSARNSRHKVWHAWAARI